jgi:hypothetical protein
MIIVMLVCVEDFDGGLDRARASGREGSTPVMDDSDGREGTEGSEGRDTDEGMEPLPVPEELTPEPTEETRLRTLRSPVDSSGTSSAMTVRTSEESSASRVVWMKAK